MSERDDRSAAPQVRHYYSERRSIERHDLRHPNYYAGCDDCDDRNNDVEHDRQESIACSGSGVCSDLTGDTR